MDFHQVNPPDEGGLYSENWHSAFLGIPRIFHLFIIIVILPQKSVKSRQL